MTFLNFVRARTHTFPSRNERTSSSSKFDTTLQGNVKNSYWHYEAVEDLSHALEFIGIFFIIDVLSVVIGELLLWWLCRIKLHSIYVELQNEFGISCSVVLATNLNAVCNNFYRSRRSRYNVSGAPPGNKGSN